MLIKILVENTSHLDSLACEHGLCMYIKTAKHRILFDSGASELYLNNAEKMRVDLQQIDTFILSHGHSDHAGGLEKFLELNQKAKIYLQKTALADYYAKRRDGQFVYIGLAEAVKKSGRLEMVAGNLQIDEELSLFTAQDKKLLNPEGNKSLYKKEQPGYGPDDFTHEHNLLLQEDGSRVLLVGCAHLGIVNILESFREVYGYLPTHVVGGFHLYNPSLRQTESKEKLKKIAEYLLESGAKFYTMHCTGQEAFQELEQLMGPQKISYLATGSQLII